MLIALRKENNMKKILRSILIFTMGFSGAFCSAFAASSSTELIPDTREVLTSLKIKNETSHSLTIAGVVYFYATDPNLARNFHKLSSRRELIDPNKTIEISNDNAQSLLYLHQQKTDRQLDLYVNMSLYIGDRHHLLDHIKIDSLDKTLIITEEQNARLVVRAEARSS